MKERIIIIFVALIAGLFITSAGFFIYQSTKSSAETDTPNDISQNTIPTPGTPDGIFVKIDEPTDESITNNRTVEIKGTTNPENTVVVSTNLNDVTGKPEGDGKFAVEVDIAAGANIIVTRSVSPDGESAEDTRTITYSTEEF